MSEYGARTYSFRSVARRATTGGEGEGRVRFFEPSATRPNAGADARTGAGWSWGWWRSAFGFFWRVKRSARAATQWNRQSQKRGPKPSFASNGIPFYLPIVFRMKAGTSSSSSFSCKPDFGASGIIWRSSRMGRASGARGAGAEPAAFVR
jgi:hypothetical protein